ncbi:MAG: MATE family efflux transporter [Spirochaetia bacterium]|jgi:MATE family multidrug resistance protein|nr:MATE family efflux transporter [Spirochaetia bacterium]
MIIKKQASTLHRLLIIAFPMVISQASDTVMMFVDRLFLSRLGEDYLAASMSGGLTHFMVSSFFIGTISYITAIVAQYYGAEKYKKCAQATFQAISLAVISYPILMAVSPLVRFFFIASGQSALQVNLAYTYFQALMFGSIFLLLRFALAGFFIGIGRTTVVMIANAVGMLVNIPLNYILIYGKLGLPALGLQGAAIGTILGNMVIFIILMAFYFRGKNRDNFATHKALKLNIRLIKTMLHFGIPAGLEMFLNISAFNLFIQAMHSYGTKVAAAVTIAFNWDVVAFIPMLGMGYAVTALVGQNIGAGDYNEARKSAYLGLKTAWIYSFTMVIIFLSASSWMVGIFVSGFEGDSEEITAMAIVMLRLVSIYIMADSAQIVFVGALRGAGDTRWVMRVSVAFHWLFAITAILLIKVGRIDPVLVWICFIVFLFTLGITMFLRFRSGKWQNISVIEDRHVRAESKVL